MMTILQTFLAIKNAPMMVSDRWSAVILTADIHSSCLHIQKKKRKKCFLHSYKQVSKIIFTYKNTKKYMKELKLKIQSDLTKNTILVYNYC